MPAPIPSGLPSAIWKKMDKELKFLLLSTMSDDDVHEDDLELVLLTTFVHAQMRPCRIRDHLPVQFPPRIQDFDDNQIHQLLGFRDHTSLNEIMVALNIPEFFTCKKKGYKMEGNAGFLLLCARLHSGARFSDLENTFHRDGTQLSAICASVLNWIYETHAHPRLSNINWAKGRMDMYNRAINDRFSVFFAGEDWYDNIPQDIWGFIDGTIRPCARPWAGSSPGMNLQKEVYSGYKRSHGLKYQAVVSPDGLFMHLYGAVPGRWHDSRMLSESGLISQLDSIYEEGDRVLKILGDPAYGKGMHIWTGFKNADADWKHYFNNALSSARVAVEWGFGMITRRWRLLSDANRQKILETGLQHQYYVATFLTNLITCVEGGNQTSSHFGCHPPTLGEYLSYH